MQRRDILKLVPLAALIPSVACSKEELVKKIERIPGGYLVLADPTVIDFSSFERGFLSGLYKVEIWPAKLVGTCEPPILIYKLT